MILVWENVSGKPENVGILSEQDVLLNGYPIKTIYNPHEGHGVQSGEFTANSKYLITLGNGNSSKQFMI